MKKRLLGIIIGVMVLGLIGCGGSKEQNGTEDTSKHEEAVAENSLEIMNTVWNTYKEEEKFAAIGGDMANPVDNAPGNFDVSDAENLDYTLAFPVDYAEAIDDCASVMHMMNANTFTGATYHVTDSAKISDVATAIKDNIQNRQWLCGFPDKLLVVQVGDDYLVSAFGNAEVMDNFKTKLLEQYQGAEVLFEETIG